MFPGRTTAVFHYTWGTERPKVKEQRHLRNISEGADTCRAQARKIYESLLSAVDRDVEREQAELEIVRASTPGGRYDRDVAATVAAKFAADFGAVEPVKRGRGRPRKYQPGDPRPPRKSRAKVRPLSIERAAGTASGFSKARSSSAGRRASSRTTSGTVSPVTAAPSRMPTPAPKAAPNVAAILLESPLAGGHGVETLQIETPATALEITPVEKRIGEITVVENDPEYAAELAEQEARAKTLLDAEGEPGEEILPEGAPRKKTKFSMNYDFSDALDRSKADPAILALFSHFGLPTTQLSEAMSEEELKRWLFPTRYSSEPDDEAREHRFGEDYRIYKNVPGIYRAVRRRLVPLIQRDRVEVWHIVHLRVITPSSTVHRLDSLSSGLGQPAVEIIARDLILWISYRRHFHDMAQDSRVNTAFIQSQPMRYNLLRKPPIMLVRKLTWGEMLQTERSIDASEEGGWKSGIHQRFEALDVRPIGISLAAGDPANLRLRNIGRQNKDRIRQRNLLSIVILNEAHAPGPLELPEQVRIHPFYVLENKHGAGILLQLRSQGTFLGVISQGCEEICDVPAIGTDRTIQSGAGKARKG